MGKFIHALWPLHSGLEDKDVSQDEVVRACLVEAGFDASVADKDMLSSAETYAANLEDAMNAGAFGAPFYVTDDDQRFWGQDRLDDLDAYLSGDLLTVVKRVLAGHPSNLSSYGFGPRKGLLLHCSLGHGGAYTKMGAALGGALSLTGFDQPGHGRAADWGYDGDLQDRVTDMALDLLSEPMDVIGHSFGGTVALRLAVERPQMVRSLALIEPVMMAVAKRDNPMAMERLMGAMSGFYRGFSGWRARQGGADVHETLWRWAPVGEPARRRPKRNYQAHSFDRCRFARSERRPL